MRNARFENFNKLRDIALAEAIKALEDAGIMAIMILGFVADLTATADIAASAGGRQPIARAGPASSSRFVVVTKPSSPADSRRTSRRSLRLLPDRLGQLTRPNYVPEYPRAAQ